ncbi:hypothetical protein AMS68_000227 [Peltaster fructicola]|uniref:Cytochrome P450 n=1 Tax=Peltaster fructicola TaxID=286661 RepID=A0A6H0XJK9_9PEZI|nr:hypothetical protein AMS68_000227 [Peltaster fructicola]
MPALQLWENLKGDGLVKTATSIPISWILGGLFAFVVLRAVFRKVRGQRYEIVNPSPAWDIFNISSVLAFLGNGLSLVNSGFQKFNGRPFILYTDVRPKIVLGPEYIDFVNAEPKLDFLAFVKSEFLTHIPAFKHFDPPGHLIEDMVRTKLTTNLAKFTVPISDEASLTLSELWGDSKEWSTHVLKDDLLNLISRLSAVIFTGGELAHDKEWQKLTVEVTVNGFLGVMECRMFPTFLQYMLSKIMPHAVRVEGDLRRGTAKVQKIMDRRQREKDDAIKNGEKPPQYVDAIAWLDELAATGKYGSPNQAIQQLSLAMAAIHTSTDLLTSTLYRIFANPELVQPLREEMTRVLGSMGWTKQALQELRLMDSLLKETQRLQATGALVMSRVALDDVELPGGIIIKKGEQMAISTHLMQSPNFYEDPDKFEPWRFAKRREDPKLMNKSHLVSTSVEHTGFSHGKHACPGRFFASNEIKIAMIHLLLKYDIELVTGESTKPVTFGTFVSSNSKAKVRVRRRQEEIST